MTWTKTENALVYKGREDCYIMVVDEGWRACVEDTFRNFEYLDDARFWIEQRVHDLHRFRTGQLDIDLGEIEAVHPVDPFDEGTRQLILKGVL